MSGVSYLDKKCIRLALNETNLVLLKIIFSSFWLTEPKCTKNYLQKSRICSIYCQSEPFSNLRLMKIILQFIEPVSIFKSPRFVPFRANLVDFLPKCDTPAWSLTDPLWRCFIFRQFSRQFSRQLTTTAQIEGEDIENWKSRPAEAATDRSGLWLMCQMFVFIT